MLFDDFIDLFEDDVEISLLKEIEQGLIYFDEDEVLECRDLKNKNLEIKKFKVIKINGVSSNVVNILVS